jgi:hypothetical protein
MFRLRMLRSALPFSVYHMRFLIVSERLVRRRTSFVAVTTPPPGRSDQGLRNRRRAGLVLRAWGEKAQRCCVLCQPVGGFSESVCNNGQSLDELDEIALPCCFAFGLR